MRQIKGYALVLKSRRVSEIHKQITLFLPDRGVVDVFANGALKSGSRFMGRTELFSLLEVELYYSPVKKSTTLKEVVVVDYFAGIREDSDRYLAVSGWAELIWKSEALGEPAKLFNLMVQSLRSINIASGASVAVVNAQFLMRYLAFGGLFPDLSGCIHCSAPAIASSEVEFPNGKGRLFFLDFVEGGICCSHCLNMNYPEIGVDLIEYMNQSMTMRLVDSLQLKVNVDSIYSLLSLLMKLVAEQLGITVKSFDLVLRSPSL